jgi:hypothetical protein
MARDKGLPLFAQPLNFYRTAKDELSDNAAVTLGSKTVTPLPNPAAAKRRVMSVT